MTNFQRSVFALFFFMLMAHLIISGLERWSDWIREPGIYNAYGLCLYAISALVFLILGITAWRDRPTERVKIQIVP